jgi:alkanesulfonate monooxygenase SsuD/methylene tetrahydromethanopterin reductase-like flavin-dependent oxidoreductase (luciferase family)
MIKIGTAVCLVVERDPITLAKEVASLDRMSGGRFLFGVGAGWNREEMANHDTDPRYPDGSACRPR